MIVTHCRVDPTMAAIWSWVTLRVMTIAVPLVSDTHPGIERFSFAPLATESASFYCSFVRLLC
jgi:hypothetical protein